ncbi:MAG TPA: methyltransferase domain-containing protein [Dehalococcoidia bacterium]|nr:methyltransferase domain-containing protein [Dehalococcoidia bacterium]
MEDVASDYADREFRYNRVMEPALAAAMAALHLRPGRRVLDAGCGPGGVLPLLFAGVAPGGTVLGLDYSAPHVERARRLVRERGLGGAVAVEVADLRADLPVADAACDVVWAADVLYPDTVGDPEVVVARLSRTLTPGGTLAVFYGNWLRALYLPGYARLEHLIDAARETMYARERRWQGEPHPERALGWLTRAGLTDCRLHVLPAVHQQPLVAEVRRYIADSILGGHYARAVEACGRDVGMTSADEDLWRRLSDRGSPEYILDQADYYCVATALLAIGVRPV